MGETLLTSGQAGRQVSIELVEWAIGPVRLVSVPGEAFHELGRAIERRGPHVLVAGLAPEWHGYLPVPFTDGYEESMSYGPEAVAAIAGALMTVARPSTRIGVSVVARRRGQAPRSVGFDVAKATGACG